MSTLRGSFSPPAHHCTRVVLQVRLQRRWAKLGAVARHRDPRRLPHAVRPRAHDPRGGEAASWWCMTRPPCLAAVRSHSSLRYIFKVDELAAPVIEYGKINATQLRAPNTSLSWLFYTAVPPGGAWEEFFVSIVWFSW